MPYLLVTTDISLGVCSKLYLSARHSEVKVAQLCPTRCDPMDFTFHGILQAGILEWVAYPFSSSCSGPRNQAGVSYIAGRFFTN